MNSKIISSCIYACISILTIAVCYSQNHDENHKKYWYYRSRLTNDFMKVGKNPSESLPWSRRNTAVGGTNLPSDDAQSGADIVSQLGEYFCVLATEYALLSKYGEDTKYTVKELYYALEAFNRLDATAEHHWGETDSYNGWFIRDDTPCDFILNNIDKLNYELQLGNSSIPTSLSDPVPPGPDNGGFLSDNFVLNLYDSKMCDYSIGKVGVDDLAMSHDQIYSVMAGLMLINKFFNNVSYSENGQVMSFYDGLQDFRSEARSMINGIV